jgi:hypothetical protein
MAKAGFVVDGKRVEFTDPRGLPDPKKGTEKKNYYTVSLFEPGKADSNPGHLDADGPGGQIHAVPPRPGMTAAQLANHQSKEIAYGIKKQAAGIYEGTSNDAPGLYGHSTVPTRMDQMWRSQFIGVGVDPRSNQLYDLLLDINAQHEKMKIDQAMKKKKP